VRARIKSSVALVAPLVGLAAMLFASTAGAVEREHSIAVGGGLSVLDVADKSSADVGAGAGLAYTYGLSDAFNLMVEGTWSLVALNETVQGAPPTRPSMVTSLDVGVAYVFDVIRWVPYVGLLAGACALNGGTIDGLKLEPGAAFALGFDYRFNRSWAAGLALRQQVFAESGTYPSYSQAFARVEYIWGW
jgi:hypothetical protein